MAAATSVHVVAIIEPIIQHADWFFPGGETPRFLSFRFERWINVTLFFFFLVLPDVDFNVSGMFALPSHPPTPDPDPGLERKRRPSQGGQDGDGQSPRKDRYLPRPTLSLSLPLLSRAKPPSRTEPRAGGVVSALYVVAHESVTVSETPAKDLPSPDVRAAP